MHVRRIGADGHVHGDGRGVFVRLQNQAGARAGERRLRRQPLPQCFAHAEAIAVALDNRPIHIVGTMIYSPKNEDFYVKKGPIFANFILADEINRAPAKVQSALLEAMQEKQVTIGSETFKLDQPFMVLATQNPIEQEGTYPLPEAQVDRFMLKVIIRYPQKDEDI